MNLDFGPGISDPAVPFRKQQMVKHSADKAGLLW